MARTVGIGIQDLVKMIENNCFYVDKTAFIEERWENQDDVPLNTRPRRFGKTLTMSMETHFFLCGIRRTEKFVRESGIAFVQFNLFIFSNILTIGDRLDIINL